MRTASRLKLRRFRFDIKENSIVLTRKPAFGVTRTGVTPNNFIPKVLLPKDSIHCHSDVAIGSMVTVEVDATGGL